MIALAVIKTFILILTVKNVNTAGIPVSQAACFYSFWAADQAVHRFTLNACKYHS